MIVVNNVDGLYECRGIVCTLLLVKKRWQFSLDRKEELIVLYTYSEYKSVFKAFQVIHHTTILLYQSYQDPKKQVRVHWNFWKISLTDPFIVYKLEEDFFAIGMHL